MMRSKSNRGWLWGLLVFVATGLTGCMSDTPDEELAPENEGEMLSIHVFMPQDVDLEKKELPSSRIAYDDSSLNLTWEAGDRLRLKGYDANGTYKGTTDFELKGNTGTTETIFQGPAVDGATQYDIFYLCTENSPITKDGVEQFTYPEQKQLTDNTTAHLKHALYIKSKGKIPAEYLKLETANIELELHNSIMRFDLTRIPTDIIQKASQLSWKVINAQGNEMKQLLLGFNNLSVANQKLTGFMCFSDMDIEKGGAIEVVLKDIDAANGNKSKVCTYTLHVNSPITFNANNRYMASVDFHNTSSSSSNRFYYKSNVPVKKEMFEQTNQPKGEKYDSKTQEGFLDFSPGKQNQVKIKDGAFQGRKDIKYIEFKEGLVEIGKNAFQNCPNLDHVELPEETKEIGKNAFSGCTNLREVDMPGVTDLDKNAFNGCTNLTEVNLPKVDEIEEGTFKGCSSLQTLELPTVTEVGKGAFDGCTNLTSVKLPLATEIENAAFKNCSKLVTLELPLVKEIGKNVFAGCTSLQKLVLSNNEFEEFFMDTFIDCTALVELHIGATNPPEIAGYYPFDYSPEKRKNPLGFQNKNIRIYVPNKNYRTTNNKIAWYRYTANKETFDGKDHYVIETQQK